MIPIDYIKYKLEINFKNNKVFIQQSAFSYFVIIFNIAISLYAIKSNILSLGKDSYGLWILTFGIFNMLGVLNLGFLNLSSLKLNKNDPKSCKEVFSGSFTLVLIQLVLFILFSITFLLHPELLFSNVKYHADASVLFIAMIPGAIFIILTSFLESFLFFNFKKVILKNSLELLRLGVLYLVFIFALGLNNHIVLLGVCFSIINAIAFLIVYFNFKKETNFNFRTLFINFKYIKYNYSLASSYWLSGICFITLSQADAIFISVFIKDLAIITMYSQCFRLQDVATKFIKKLTESKLPKIFEALNLRKFDVVINIYKKLMLVNLFFSVLATVAIIFTGKIVLEWWLEKNIIFEQKLIFVISFMCITSSLHNVFWNFLNINQNRKKISLIAVSEITSNIILSYFLIKKIGVIGLPIASIISQLQSILMIYIPFKNFKKNQLLLHPELST